MKTILKLLPLILGLAISGVIAYFGEAWAGDRLYFQLWLFTVGMVTFFIGIVTTINLRD